MYRQLLDELLTRIKENCAGSNHELTKDQLDDIQDSLLPFVIRFDKMETVCELANRCRSQLNNDLQNKLQEVFDNR